MRAWFLTATSVFAAVASGCAGRVAVPPSTAGCTLHVRGVVVFCGDARYATIERHFCRRPEDGTASGLDAGPAGDSCFALSVAYADGSRAWLYRGRDFEQAVRRGTYQPVGDTEGKLGGAYDIRVTDGGRVRFKLPPWAKEQEYDLNTGTLR